MSVTKGTVCDIHETSVTHKRGAPKRVEKETDLFTNGKGEVFIRVNGKLVNISQDTVALYRNYEVIDGQPLRTDIPGPTTHRCMSCYSKNRPYCFFQSDWRENVPSYDIKLPVAEIRWRSRT